VTEPAGAEHAALVSALRDADLAPAAVIDAFAAVPRHLFLPGVGPAEAYCDDAIVTTVEDGVPTSSSTQPSLMARMLALLELEPGQRVLEVGAGTGYNAALMAALGARVTTVELQPAVAAAAREHLATAGAADAVDVVCGDGAAPPPGPFDRIIVTAGLWAVPAALADVLAEDGRLVAPLRINGVELAVALRKRGPALSGTGGIPCGFMPLQGPDERPRGWGLGGGGTATADADLGVEGRGALDRLLASEGRAVLEPLALREGEHVLHALLWLGLQGDPLLTLAQPREGGRGPRWTAALYVMPASLLVLDLGARNDRVAAATLYGGEAALRTCSAGMDAWRAAGAPGPAALEVTIEPHDGRGGWTLPYREAEGAATMVRGAHRWRLAYG
jgi:protein-L-isoaspartate(D-aspartate) O-methyltransferase